MYSLEDIRKICGGDLRSTGPGFPILKVRYFAYDTRSLSDPSETLFFALKTNHRDGHAFLQDAFRKGVRQFIVSHIPPGAEGNFLVVDHPLHTIQKLAAWHRRQFSIPVIGITGSNGKTIVKEWVSALIGPDREIIRSPGSFNSSLGVPVSVLRMNEQHELALFEAGISQQGEMNLLEDIIRPDTVLLTHLGEAHAEGFPSYENKVQEKLKLAGNALSILTWETQRSLALQAGIPVRTIGPSATNDVVLENLQQKAGGWSFRIGTTPFFLPQEGPSGLENAGLALLTALEYGIPIEVLAERIQHLHAIPMRMEMITDNPTITVLNDAFTSDPDSVRNAFQTLNRVSAQPRKMVILSDLDHQGRATIPLQAQLMNEAINLFGQENLILIGPVFCALSTGMGITAYPEVGTLLSNLDIRRFEHAAVLLKGARRFSLERLVPLLSGRVSATYFRIDLTSLISNYRILKGRLSPGKKIMAMVKASAYGSGSWEIARELETEGVDYLAVAYISEGVTLREKGIRTPVMVMNPDPEGLGRLGEYDLEPVVYSLPFLEELLSKTDPGKVLKVHIEVESGMMRLGFPADEGEKLRYWLERHERVQVASVFTHLAASDIAGEDDFTREQFDILRQFAREIRTLRPHFLLHAQNTAGAIRFLKEPDLDMVRLGIGLYGLAPGPEEVPGLKETGSLISRISQLHHCPMGKTVGYNRSLKAARNLTIATIPLGYADGIPRNLSNGKVAFRIKGKAAPIAGTICMDMTMLDVTDIPGVKTGDEVLIFGQLDGLYQSVQTIAQAADTIPYEIITGIHPRVRRIYVRE